MEYALEGEAGLNALSIDNLITKQLENIHQLQPLEINLKSFDELLQGGSNGC